jgi:amidase
MRYSHLAPARLLAIINVRLALAHRLSVSHKHGRAQYTGADHDVGSTIRPASYNGIYGMKPTWTSISREGMKLLAISLDTLGLYARSVEDIQLLCEVFRLEDDVKPADKPLSEMKIAMLKTPIWDMGFASPDLEKAWNQAEELLKAAGIQVSQLEMSPEFNEVPSMTRTIMFTEARTAFLGDYVRTPVSLNPEFKAHVENKEGFSRADQLKAYDHTARMRTEWDELAKEFDVRSDQTNQRLR